MTRTAFCRKSPRVPRGSWVGSWALGTSDRGGQDKGRKVRPVGWLGNGRNFRRASNIAKVRRTLPISRCSCPFLSFATLRRAS